MAFDMIIHLLLLGCGWDSNKCVSYSLWSDGHEIWRHQVVRSLFDTIPVFEPILTYSEVELEQQILANGGILCQDLVCYFTSNGNTHMFRIE